MIYDVIVVGGGYTGIATAHELERLAPAKKILVLEASAVLGGRAQTLRETDLGAHYFGSKHRRLMKLAKHLAGPEVFNRAAVYGPDPAQRAKLAGEWKLTTRKTSFFDLQGLTKECPPAEWIMIFRSLAEAVMLESTVNLKRPWLTRNAARLDQMSFQEWIDKQALTPWLREMWEFAALGILSVHARDISFLYWLWYTASNGGFLQIANDYEGGPQEFSVRCGLGGLLQRFAQQLRCEVRMQTPVTRVDQTDHDQVRLTTANGDILCARQVVVAATPHAVGKHIQFQPPLSPERERLMKQRMGHAIKVIAIYDKPFWRDSHGKHFYGYLSGPFTEEIEWILDTSRPDGSQYSLMMFVSEQLDLARLADAAVAITGDPRAAEFSRVEICDWRAQPYIGGGPNTSFACGVLSRMTKDFCEPEGRVFFASSEQSTEFTGYVEGALACAEQVVHRLVKGQAKRGASARTPAKRMFATSAFVALTPALWAVRLNGVLRSLNKS